MLRIDADADDGKGNKHKTSEKRKLQNRQAQRNFRERKEKVSLPSTARFGSDSEGSTVVNAAFCTFLQHLKELEDRVLSLEQQTTDQGTENAALKQLLER